MNKKQIETKRLFWKIVEVIENISDTTTKDANGRTLERGMLLENGSVKFSLEEGIICVYTENHNNLALVFTENSEELLLLKELFGSIDGVHELIKEEKDATTSNHIIINSPIEKNDIESINKALESLARMGII